jgi:hypothetical protein
MYKCLHILTVANLL